MAESDVLHRLSLLDRFLPAWIGVAMVLGLLLGAAIPQLDDWLDKVKIGTVSLPIAIGLLLMMYPVLAKVRYRRLDEAIDRRFDDVLPDAQLGHRSGADVRARLAVPVGSARVPHRSDHRRAGSVHRHGADLERPRLR